MKQLAIVSGKGGTGKTVVSASLATLARNAVFVDCDVDAANLYLLLHPEIMEAYKFYGMKKARIDKEKCSACRECMQYCRFEAVSKTENNEFLIDPVSCEGCEVCLHICPERAVEMKESISGEWFVSRTGYGPFIHAKLGIGEENSGKLVTQIRKKAQEIAQEQKRSLTIIDGPPGIGCPLIASLSGTDLALVVTEPTLSGLHDMVRVIDTAHHFKTQTACCINKYDINLSNSARIEKWCLENSVPLLGKIPFDDLVSKSIVQQVPLTEFSECPASSEIRNIWGKLKDLLILKEMDS